MVAAGLFLASWLADTSSSGRSEIRPVSIVLMRCRSQATAGALPKLLAALDRRGYSVVTIGELLRSG